MKIPITLKAAALALAGIALGTSLSRGALVYNQGDIILAFRVANGTSPSYLVNLGSVTQFTNAVPGSTLSFGSISTIGQDLVDTYGSSWYDLSTLSWGLFGQDENANLTLYASRARTGDLSTAPALWNALTITNRNTTDTNVSAVTVSFINSGQTTASTNTSNAGFQSFTTNGSYYYAVTTGATDFGSVSQWSSIEASNASGIDSTALDLIKVGATGAGAFPSSDLGKFTIDDSGVITFTATVPEPSTYALLATSGVVFMVFLRRRRAALQA